MLHRLVVLAAVCGLVVRAAPALEQQALEKKVVLVATPSRFDGDKQVYEIPRSDVYVNVKFGTQANSPNNTVILTLESTAPLDIASETNAATSWVYGKSCTSNCPDANKEYDQSGTPGKSITLAAFKGQWYADSITIGPSATVKTDFVALTQRFDAEPYDGGLLSLGINTLHQTVDKLLGIGKDPWITIYTGTSSDGQLVIGRNGHDKCNNAATWGITGDGWAVEKTSIEVDGTTKKDNQRLEFSITKPATMIPSDSYDAVTKDANVASDGTVPDISKLKTIKITIGSNSWTLKPEDFTSKDNNGKQSLQLGKTTDNFPAIVLGNQFLKSRCLVLGGDASDKSKWQVGVGDPKSGAGVFGLSALLLSVVSVFHFLRL
ncbi:hypothetical protein M3Y99_01576500 [Aphelenchoides fujianensis]|nr:hypothetical protein M3Y99_01576500 [Aphelenchoides fujianensis]